MAAPTSQLPSPAIPMELSSGAAWTWAALHMAERCACGVSVVALAPLAAVLGCAVVIASGRSPLIAHRRVGWKGETLWMLKYRTMWDSRPGRWDRHFVECLADSWVPAKKLAADPRVTHPLARWMRRFSLDELPQLWHVAVGQMALAGPRPLTAGELREHYGTSAQEMLSVRPGITGLWQVMGRNRLSYAQRRRLDLFLARKRSLRLYCMILARTIPAVLRGEDSR
jgi:exopolysaccharide production protein ExoY